MSPQWAIIGVLILVIFTFYGSLGFREGNTSNTDTDISGTRIKGEKINIFYPNMTFVDFDGEKYNSDTSKPSKYNSRTSPKDTSHSRTNNMFSAQATSILPFNNPVHNVNPFASSSPPDDSTQFGPVPL